MSAAGVVLTGADPVAYIEHLAAEWPLALARAVLRAGQEAQGEIAQAVMETLTKRPTGALARSFEVVFEAGASPRVVVSSRLPYADIQNRGGVIQAKRTKYLAIPLDGVPRGMRPREFGRPLVFSRTKGGGGMLAEVVGKGRLKPRFALKRSVRIAGGQYIQLALSRLEARLPEITETELRIGTERAEAAAQGGAS